MLGENAKMLLLERNVLGEGFLKIFIKSIAGNPKMWKGVGGAELEKFFVKIERELAEVFPNLRTKAGKMREGGWDDVLEYIFAKEGRDAKFLKDFFDIRIVQDELIKLS